MDSPDLLLQMRDIRKVFPGNVALDDASLEVRRGEVHALVGQNGAGKSTMIKILTGAYQRDGGTIVFDGRPVEFRSPTEAQASGISTIYQEINLVPLRSVAENIMLGKEPTRLGMIDWRKMNATAADLLRQVGIEIDVTRPLGEFNIAIQQMVAIARAVSFKSQLVVMDEPTSSLDDQEVETLFNTIRRLKANGVSVIFISHRLDELYTICDRVTIMRDGKTIDSRDVNGSQNRAISKLELVARMLGREIGEVVQRGATSFSHPDERTAGETILEVRDILTDSVLRNVSLSVRQGEIIGLAGLLGAGRTETARAIFGADPIRGGEIRFNGQTLQLGSPISAIQAGMGYCSEDRKAEGIIPELSVADNLVLAALPQLSRGGVVSGEKRRQIVEEFIKLLGIKTSSPDQPIRELSGGNQQKVLLARWLCLHPNLLILDEPTRGIDVGAKGEIQKIVSQLAENGVGVLMITSEIEELTEGSDRVFVMREGASVAELDNAEITQAAIMQAIAHGPTTEASPGAGAAGAEIAANKGVAS